MKIKKIIIILIIIYVVIFLLTILIFVKKNNINNMANRASQEPQQNYTSTRKTDFQTDLEKAKKIVSFPIKYPQKLPEGYKFSKINAWSGDGEGVYIYYKKNENNLFYISEVNSDPYSNPLLFKEDTTILPNGKMGHFFLYKNRGELLKNIFLFDSLETEKQTIYYSIVSNTLSEEEIIDIASSMTE